MRRGWLTVLVVASLALPLAGQSERLWVLHGSGEMVEYDPATFKAKETVKIPPEVAQAPQNLQVNGLGQMLFVAPVNLPMDESDIQSTHKVWLWNGTAASSFSQGLLREEEEKGSNVAVEEAAPVPYLSADGAHLFWFANQAHRLVREDVDLSTVTTWQAWQTDMSGMHREELATAKLPECHCKTGACEDSCPYFQVWVPQAGAGKFFLLTQVTVGQTQPVYAESSLYRQDGGKWTASVVDKPWQRLLDASADGGTIVEAIPDTGCCGWTNRSNDQTLALVSGKSLALFDELATYKNPDYDVSFFTSNAKLSPDATRVAMTIVSTAQANKPIQLAEEGQASLEETARIRKALTELPAVEVKSVEDVPKRLAYLPHATLVGWVNDKEILIVENRMLVGYNLASGARRKSTLAVGDAAHVFLR